MGIGMRIGMGREGSGAALPGREGRAQDGGGDDTAVTWRAVSPPRPRPPHGTRDTGTGYWKRDTGSGLEPPHRPGTRPAPAPTRPAPRRGFAR